MTRALAAIAIVVAVVVAITLAAPRRADAGGFFLPTHGTRALGRAGAFLAGGDDPSAIWYNPASLSQIKRKALLFDLAAPLFSSTYDRVDSGGNVQPRVTNKLGVLPVPTLAYALPLITGKLWTGASFSAPLGVLPEYPRPNYAPCDTPNQASGCVDTADADAPQRYSLISFAGTLVLRLDLAVAWRPLPWLTVGASLQNTFARMSVLKTLSSYNGVLSSGPEDPDFDSLTRLTVADMFNPSAKFGVTVQPLPWLRIATTVQLPTVIDAEGTVEVQLPTSPVYDASSVVGSAADVRFSFPLELAFGVEVRPVAGLRIELDVRWERWSATGKQCPAAQLGGSQATPGAAGQCEILITPRDIFILDIPGIPSYKVPPLAERFGYQDAFSVHLGGEYTLPKIPLSLRAGYAFERGAVPTSARSVFANDPTKHFITAGASYSFGNLRVDAAYAVVVSAPSTVGYRDSEARQTNPINPSDAVTIGGGSYALVGHVFGLGINWQH